MSFSQHIRQRVVLDCSPALAWRAIHSPRAAGELYAPWVVLRPSAGASAFPGVWRDGDEQPVDARVFGVVPLGRSLIRVRHGRVRLPSGRTIAAFHDAGQPLSGPLALLDSWDHRMAVEPIDGDPDRCVWHERLVVTGRAAVLLGPVLRLAWALRVLALRAAARGWTRDS